MNNSPEFRLVSSFAANLKRTSIFAIYCIWYVFEEKIDKSHCFIQIEAADNSVLTLQPGNDGERLGAQAAAWIDPFSSPLSEDNVMFVATHGKWTSFDQTALPPFSLLVGTPVINCSVFKNVAGKIVGFSIKTANQTLNYLIDCDEGVIRWGSMAQSEKIQMQIIEETLL